jgi:molybdopterin adenylyltransferase
MGGPSSAAVVTVSDGVVAGTRKDGSGDVAEELLRGAGYEAIARSVVPDERVDIEARLRSLALDGVSLVVTTGGTGFGPRDVTPEATRSVIDREAPGLAELMRHAGLEKTPMAALSRGVAGSLGRMLVLNLPGSPAGVRESLEAVLPVVPHALELLAGQGGPHPTGHADREGQGARFPGVPSWVEVKAVKVEGSPPCRVGNSMAIVPGGEVHGTLGCAEFDEEAARDAVEVLASGEPQTRTYRHDQGNVEVYLEPHSPGPILVIVSATDVARALRGLVQPLGFQPVIVEPRSERLAQRDRELSHVSSLEDVDLGPDAFVVFTDHDAPGVADMLAAALRSPAGFIGVMGSRRHVGPYLEQLRSHGFSDADLARIRSPVGLDLGGRIPQEIALSIAAGLVAARNERQAGWLDRP